MKITIPGHPFAKKRHRCACRGRHPVAYDSQAAETKKQRLALCDQIDREHLAGTIHLLENNYLHLNAIFYIEPPPSNTKSSRNAKLWGLELPTQSDLDNRIKYLCDLGNGILWTDDAKIVSINAIEKYAESACTILEIHAIKFTMNDKAAAVTKLFSPTELELLQTHLCLLRDSLAQIERYQGDDKKYYIEHASVELVIFANEYADKLKKLAKMA